MTAQKKRSASKGSAPSLPEGRPPLLKDIAAAAGVSMMTISNVLRSRAGKAGPLYTKETEERVRRIAGEMGYVTNRFARAMRTRKTGIVGFVSANFHERRGNVANYVVYPFLVGMSHSLTAQGQHVALMELSELEMRDTELPEALQERMFDGLVLHYGVSEAAQARLVEVGIPLVYWDSGRFDAENCIYRPEEEVGRAVTERLLELGHRRIALLCSPETWNDHQAGRVVHYSFVDRRSGYEEAMRGRSLTPKYIVASVAEDIAAQIKKGGITAIALNGSYMAVLRAATLLGITVPEQLSVLSCDVEGSFYSPQEFPGGACYDRYATGRAAAQMMFERLHDGGRSAPSVRLPIRIEDGATAVRCRR